MEFFFGEDYFTVYCFIFLDIHRTIRLYWIMRKPIIGIATIVDSGFFHIIRGMDMTMPMTGIMRITRRIVRFFIMLSLLFCGSLIISYDSTIK